MNSKMVLIPIALIASAVACDGGDGKKKDAASDAKPATSAAAPMSAEDIEKADIPVESDFEDEAFEQIDADNLDAEVDKLAREIEGG